MDSVPLGTSGLEELSLRVNVDCISPGPSDVGVDCNPPGSSDEEDPSLGVTDGGMLGRGLPSQGSLVDVERAVIIEGGR